MSATKTKPERVPETEAPPEPEGKFEIIYTNAVLNGVKPGEAPDQVLAGSVARLSDGRVFCRVVERDIDGTPTYGWAPFVLDPMLRVESVNPTPTFAAKEFQRDADHWRRYGGLVEYRPRDYRSEAEKFEAIWKEIHPAFDLLRDFPAPLFCPGVVSYPRTPNPPYDFDHNWITGRVLEHTTGNFGLLGTADMTPMSEEELFSEGLLERSRRNIAAIMRGSGEVMSEFLLRPFEQQKWRAIRNWQQDFAALRIKTLLRHGNNQTLVFVVESKG